MSGLDGQKAYVGASNRRAHQSWHTISVQKANYKKKKKTYKALRVTKRQASIKAWPHRDLRAQLSTK